MDVMDTLNMDEDGNKYKIYNYSNYSGNKMYPFKYYNELRLYEDDPKKKVIDECGCGSLYELFEVLLVRKDFCKGGLIYAVLENGGNGIKYNMDKNDKIVKRDKRIKETKLEALSNENEENEENYNTNKRTKLEDSTLMLKTNIEEKEPDFLDKNDVECKVEKIDSLDKTNNLKMEYEVLDDVKDALSFLRSMNFESFSSNIQSTKAFLLRFGINLTWYKTANKDILMRKAKAEVQVQILKPRKI